MPEGSLDILQVLDYIRGLNQERTAKKAVQRSPQLLGMEGPSAGPIDPAIFTNPAFVRALAARTGQLDAEATRAKTGAETSRLNAEVPYTQEQTRGLKTQNDQFPKDVERLGGVSPTTFNAITARQGEPTPEERGQNRALTARGLGNEEDKVKLLRENMQNEATAKFVESLIPLSQILGGKDVGGLASTALSTITNGPFAGLSKALEQRKGERAKLLSGVLGAGGAEAATPGATAPMAPGNVFSNPEFQKAFARYAQANNLYLPGMSPEASRIGAMMGGGGAGMAGGIPQLQSAKGPQDVTAAARGTGGQLQNLLKQLVGVPQSPAEEKSRAGTRKTALSLSSDYQTFVDAARQLGVQDVDQFNQLMLQLQELGMVPAKGK